MDYDDEPENLEEKKVVEQKEQRKEKKLNKKRGAKSLTNLKKEKILKKNGKETEEDCNIYTQIDDIQINDKRMLEYLERNEVGCTKLLKFKAQT